MEVGHSRLLKFLLPNNLTKMSEQQELRIEYISGSTPIESVVPGKQPLRQPTDDITENNGDKPDEAKNDDSTFVPVFNMKIEESAFTKGDLKLQKVSVTENISVSYQHLFKKQTLPGKTVVTQDKHTKVVNPMYSEIHSEVINDGQPIRTLKDITKSDDDSEGKKSRSRIPKLRQVAEKFKQEKKEERERGIPSRQPRRSSIPKLRRARKLSNKDSENVPAEDEAKPNKQEKFFTQPKTNNENKDSLPPEEEFEQMFDEIIQNDDEPILDANVLVDNMDDAEKLEYSFEEIVHDYEENKLPPIDIRQIKNKTLLVKQKSLPEGKFSKKLERRSSLKDIPVDNSGTDRQTENKVNTLDNAKAKIGRRSKKENYVNLRIARSQEDVTKLENSNKNITANVDTVHKNLQNNRKEVKESKNFVTPIFNEQQNVFSKDETKEEKVKHAEILHYDKENVEEKHQSPKIMEEQKPSEGSSQTPKEIHTKVEDSVPTFKIIKPERKIQTPKDIHNYNTENDANVERKKIPTLRERFSELRNKYVSDEQTLISNKKSVQEMPSKKSTNSKIAVFNKNAVTEKEKPKEILKPADKTDAEIQNSDPKIIGENLSTKTENTGDSNAVSNEQINEIEKSMNEISPQEMDLTNESKYSDVTTPSPNIDSVEEIPLAKSIHTKIAIFNKNLATNKDGPKDYTKPLKKYMITTKDESIGNSNVVSNEQINKKDKSVEDKISQKTGLCDESETSIVVIPPPHKDSLKEIPPKKSILSKIAAFNKTPTEAVKLKDTSKPDIKNTIPEINCELLPMRDSNVVSIEQTSKIDKSVEENNLEKIDLTNEAKPLVVKSTNQEDNTKQSLLIPLNIHQKPMEKLKCANSFLGKPIELKSKNITPPNTPQVRESDPYTDSADLAGEPKVLNIDNESDTEVDIVTPKQIDEQINQIVQQNEYYERRIFPEPIKQQEVIRPKQSARDVYNQYDRSQSINFDSPNPDEFDRAPLFKAVNKRIENNVSIKEKVTKLMNRIDSVDERSLDPPKNTVELPVKKSVSSRIAMFERQTSTPSDSNPKLKQHITTKPKIIQEVLKAQPPRDIEPKDKKYTSIATGDFEDRTDDKGSQRKNNVKGHNRNILIYENIEHVAKVIEVQDLKHIKSKGESTALENNEFNREDDLKIHKDIDHVARVVEVQDLKEDNNQEEDSVFNEVNHTYVQQSPPKDRDLITRDGKVGKNFKGNEVIPTGHKIDSAKTLLKEKQPLPTHDKEVLVSKIKERLKRVKSINEESDLRKSKSVAELDLGDAVKGKVHLMVVRMNSMEKIDVEKKHDIINKKERPRARSVSEKIAMFESKLVPIEMDSTTLNPIVTYSSYEYDNQTTPIRPVPKIEKQTTTPSPPKTTTNEYYKQRIEGLKNARLKYGHMEDMMYVKLKNGQDMPVIALGTSLVDPILLPHVIGAAIDLGYRAIDTAFIYGNEEQVGAAIRAKINDGTVKREDLFIIGKLWSTFHQQDLVAKACVDSLERMGLDYFDLYLIHNPMSLKEGGEALPRLAGVLQFSQSDYLDAWYGMEEVYKKGLARSIGVSNFNSVEIERLVEKGKVKPVVNQVECHPYLNQLRLSQFCADRNVTLQCFGVLGSKDTPKEYRQSTDSVIEDPLIKVMAAGLNISVGQLLLRYQIERGHTVVVKSTSAAHLWDNLQALTIRLDDIQIDALNALNRNKRTYALIGLGETHPNYPFRIPF